MGKSSAVTKAEVKQAQRDRAAKARAALAAKRAAANSGPTTRAVVLDADIVAMLDLVATVNAESPSTVIRRLFASARKPGAKV